MLDDFFTRALVAGIGVALIAGPFGCFIVWRRMAYFGDTMAHAALLGIAFGFLLEIDLMLGVFVIGLGVSLALVLLGRRGTLPTDSLLGILSHATLALGLVLIGLMATVRVDLLGYLFGDVLAVSRTDIALIWGGGVVVLALLAIIWRPLLAGTISPDIAAAEGLRPDRANLVFIVLLAAIIAVAMKVVGILLITSLLIIPAAAARRLTVTPEAMAIVASAAGAVAVAGGLYGSLAFDIPSGPSIVTAAFVLFVLSLAPGTAYRVRKATVPNR